MNGSMAISAVVLAAGRGRRFRSSAGDPDAPSGFKQLHVIDGRSMLATVLDALEQSRVADVVAVVHREIADAITSERPATARRVYVVNPRDSEMIESAQLGLKAAFDRRP